MDGKLVERDDEVREMLRQVEFFFDFGSPYTYLAYRALPRIVTRNAAQIVWRPMLLGAVFQATGNRSPAEVQAKSRHLHGDMQRWARHWDTQFTWNPHFIINTMTLMRGAVGYQLRAPEQFLHYVETIFDAMWVAPRNLGDPTEVAAALSAGGLDVASFQALVGDPEVKATLKRNTEEAVARGVFGAPSFFVSGELFWGQDRLHFVEAALAESDKESTS